MRRNQYNPNSSTVGFCHSDRQCVFPNSKFSAIAVIKFEVTERLDEQAYFWTAEWQKHEKEANEDIKSGRVKRFSSAKEAINYMRSSE